MLCNYATVNDLKTIHTVQYHTRSEDRDQNLSTHKSMKCEVTDLKMIQTQYAETYSLMYIKGL
jgi:hypothetical protein